MTTISDPSWFVSTTPNKNSNIVAMKTKSLDSTTLPCSLLENAKLPKKKTRQRRPVKFDDRAEATIVHHLEPREDAKQLWFSKREIKALREEGKATLSKVKKAGGDTSLVDESMGESLRGLEHGLSVRDRHDEEAVAATVDASSALSDADSAAASASVSSPLGRSQRRKNIVATILSQQNEQKESGIDDAKGLQVTATACTQWARDRAVDQAQKDFDDAVQVWKEDAACASLLSSILNKKTKRSSIRMRRSSSLVAAPSDAEQRKMTLDSIQSTLANALEELEDLDF